MPKRDADPVSTTAPVYDSAVAALSATGTEFALIGGLAANLYRTTTPARLTRDIDFAAIVGDAAHLDAITAALADRGWELVRVLRDEGAPFLAQYDMATAGLRAHLDLMIAATEFERAAISGASADPDHVARPEHIIVYKLIADRPHDRDDIDAILAGVAIDGAEVERWARVWEVEDRWRAAQARAVPRRTL